MGPMVGPLPKMILNKNCWEGQSKGDWHKAVQAGNKMQMLGMILVSGEELNSRECFQRSNGYRIIEETESTRIPKEQLQE